MSGLVRLLLQLLSSLVTLLRPGGARALVAENLMLRHQLLILARSRKRAPKLDPGDRILLGVCARLVRSSRIPKLAIVLKPATLLAFHEALVKRKYRRLFSNAATHKPGPKGQSRELIPAIVGMKQRNPGFGCPRIAQQISRAFGIEVNKDVVRRVLAKHYRPRTGPGNSPSWLSFIGHQKDSLWSVDLFRCESIALKSHWVLVVMDQFSRRLIGFGIHAGDVGGPTLCRMFNHAIADSGSPKYLSSDNEPLFTYHQWQANLRILDVDELKSVPYVPCSHPYVERLIGTLRSEFLDRALFWNAADLERKLDDFRKFYNDHRTHSGLNGRTPMDVMSDKPVKRVPLGNYDWESHCRGLFQLPVSA